MTSLLICCRDHQLRTLGNNDYTSHSNSACAPRESCFPLPFCERRSGCMNNPLLRLVFLNMLVCGIEFCASAGFTYIPPMLLKAGFGEASMTCLMGIGPFLALLTVPVLGRWSDRCQSRWGRRRPFIFGIAMLMIMSLILIAYGQRLGSQLAPGLRLGVGFLVLGVIFLDYGCHAGFNPCEALVADMMKHSDNKDQGFTVYSNMISLGGCIGYLITAMDWSGSFISSKFDGQEQMAFTFILLLYICSLATTMIFADENLHMKVPPTTLDHAHYSVLKPTTKPVIYDDNGYETGSNDSQEELSLNVSISSSRTPTPTLDMSIPVAMGSSSNHMTHLRRLPLKALQSSCRTFFLWPLTIFSLPQKACTAVIRTTRRFLDVPLVLRLLFVSDFCSWTALMCHNMFYTDYIGQAIYGGNPNAEDGSIDRSLYDAGVRMGSWGLLLHSITSIFYASFLQKVMMKWYGMQRTYFFGLAVFTLCMAGTMISNNLAFINILAALSGTGFAAITTVPYMLVTAYHSNKEQYFSDFPTAVPSLIKPEVHEADDFVNKQGELDESDNETDDGESRGFGADIAVLDSAYFLSQIILSLFVGTIVDITHSVTAYIAISTMFGILACYYSTKVIFPPHQA